MLAAIINLNPEHFRALLRRQGEPVVWFPAARCGCNSPGNPLITTACDCEHGYRYQQAELDSAVRVWFDRTRRRIVDERFGLVEVGSNTLAAMYDEVPASFADKFMRPWAEVMDQTTLTRGEGTDDSLPQPYPTRIVQVSQAVDPVDTAAGETTFVAGQDYELANANTGGNTSASNAIHWLDNAPAAGQTYRVRYFHRPLYWFLGELEQEAVPSRYTDGTGNPIPLPYNAALSLKHPALAQTGVA
jgi:hypothetical protein